MTKQHFIALADTIRDANRGGDLLSDLRFTTTQIEALADFCRAQNPRFNRSRWIAYVSGECGPNGGTRKGRR